LKQFGFGCQRLLSQSSSFFMIHCFEIKLTQRPLAGM
jgi:hypothetical protein